jgi:glycosyltransferase involved in cell wall biosynthesis
MAIKVCFVGGARYSRPLDPTSEKKFRCLSALGKMFVVGFSSDFRFYRFNEHADFYLLPQLGLPVFRYVELFVFGQILIFWLIVRRGVRVVVAQSPYEGFAAALARKIAGWFGCRARLVVEIHGDFEESLFLQRDVYCPGFYRFLMTRIAGYSIKEADLLRTISHSTKKQIHRWAPGKTVVQFPAWTDLDTFFRTGRRDRDNLKSVIYAGVLTPLKGIHHLINAFSRVVEELPNATLFIVGKDENKTYAADLKKQIDKLAVNDRVQFVGAQPQSHLARWMAEATVLVLPSMSEGLGRVILEAMAAGTPVIGSDVGGIPELIEDGVTGFLFPPGDEDALAGRLRWALSRPDKAREMGERARNFASRSFSTESYLNGYKQIFDLVQ